MGFYGGCDYFVGYGSGPEEANALRFECGLFCAEGNAACGRLRTAAE